MRRAACAVYLRLRTLEGVLFKTKQKLMGARETRDHWQAEIGSFVSPEAHSAQTAFNSYQHPPDEWNVNHTPIKRVSRRTLPLLSVYPPMSVYPPTCRLTHPQSCSVLPPKKNGEQKKAKMLLSKESCRQSHSVLPPSALSATASCSAGGDLKDPKDSLPHVLKTHGWWWQESFSGRSHRMHTVEPPESYRCTKR